MKKLNKKNISILLFIAAVICAIGFLVILFHYDVVTSSVRIILAILTGALLGIAAFFTFTKKNAFSLILNIVLVIAMIFGCVVIPSKNRERENLFKEPAKGGKTTINFYVMNTDLNTSDDINDYKDRTFIVQKEFDEDNELAALSNINNTLGTNVKTDEMDSVLESLQSFYDNKDSVLILNQSFIAKAKTLSEFKNFDTDTKCIYSVELGSEEATADNSNTEKDPFVVLIAGSDTRDDALTVVTRTDVDMLMAVNPNTRQIVLISIPRDYYIYNPGLDGLDKLTHLGNMGVLNTVDGINKEFSLSITDYLCTNFTHFKSLVDALGGITVNNPYAFTTINGGPGYHFDEGEITLDGEHALAYARERYALDNGDFDRNEHETIIMQALMEKVQQLVKEGEESKVLTSLTSNFLTNMDFTTLYNLYTSQSDADSDWQYIRYNLGGIGKHAGTVSMGWDTMLYVCDPIDSQVTFVTDTINKLMNGETLTQEELPNESDTTYVAN